MVIIQCGFSLKFKYLSSERLIRKLFQGHGPGKGSIAGPVTARHRWIQNVRSRN